MGKKLFVGHLTFSTTGADLESLFASAAILIVAAAAHPEFFASSFSQLGPAMP